jgi:endonuclease/exonuclease/phosphatase family metal-dependent hydrolase
MADRLVFPLVALAATHLACAAPGYQTLPSFPTDVPDPGPRERIEVVTYNLYWRNTDAEARGPAILAQLRARDPDLIAFQEVGSWFGDLLDESGFVRDGGYAATSLDGETVAPHRLLLLTRFPVVATEVYRLSAGRASVVITRLLVNGRVVSVANVHLESRLEKKEVRVAQIKDILAHLGEGEAILLGDFNFGDGEEPESSIIPATFVDVWPVLMEGDPGLTWDRERNAWADVNSYNGEPSRRLDRILVRSGLLVPEEAGLLGVEPVDGVGRQPSDHFGLRATLRDTGLAPHVPSLADRLRPVPW